VPHLVSLTRKHAVQPTSRIGLTLDRKPKKWTPRTSDASRSVTSPENMPARTLQRVSGPFQHQYASRGDLPPFLRKRYCRSHRGCSSRSRPRYPRLGQPVAPAWFAGEAAHSTKANPLLHALFVESGQDPPFPILRNFHH